MHAGSKFLFKVVGTGTVVTKLVTKSITTGASTLLVEYLCTKDYKTIVFLYTCRYFHCYLTRIPVYVNLTKSLALLGKTARIQIISMTCDQKNKFWDILLLIQMVNRS